MSLSPQRNSKARLTDILSDLFILATQLKITRDYGQPDRLRQRIVDIFDDVDKKGINAGLPKETLQEAKYAIAAFLDEIILNSPWPEKEQWSARPLQYEFFRESMAGVEFFNRLETLRRSAATQRDVLEVYYTCLILGFEGQYKLHGEAKLKDLIAEISREIEASHGSHPSLSPNGKRPEEFIAMVKQGFPSWVMVVGCLTIVFSLFMALSFLIQNDVTDVVQNLNRLIEVQ